MSNTIQIKRGSGTPTTSNTSAYELAYDYTNNKLYIHDGDSSSMVEIGGLSSINNSNWSGTDLAVANGGTGASSFTSNAILTGNGTSAIQAESSLTFDGAALNLLTTTANRRIEIGLGATQDVTSFIDLIGDTTYSDYGGRFIRYGGANAITQIMHRGTGALRLLTQDSAPIDFLTGSAERMRINSSGNVGIGETSIDANLHITGSPVVLKMERSGVRAMRMGTPDNSAKFIFADSDDLKSNIAIAINSSRHVGIGTDSPANELHVAGSMKADTSLLIGSNSNFLTSQLKVGDGTRDIRLNANHSSNAVVGTVGSHSFSIMTANTFRMTVDSAGVVDILNKMTLPASHSADKITMYDGGNEKIGTEANTLLFTADNLKVKDTSGNANLTWNSHTLTVSGNNANGINMAADGSDTNNSERIFFTGSSTSCIFQQGADLSFRTGATAGSSSGTERVSINTNGLQIHSGSLGVGVGPNSNDGRITTSSHIRANNGTGGCSLTANDGGGNASITFNHESQVPEQNGNSARIHVNTDVSSDAHIEFEVASNVTASSSVSTTDVCQMRDGSIDIQQNLRHLGDTNTLMEFGTDTISFDTGGTQALRITSSQYVSIGNTVPYERLYVQCEDDTSPGIVSNPASTNGAVAYAIGYGDANKDYLCTWGMDHSSGANVFGFGVKPHGSTSAAFISSADNANFVRGALYFDDELRFFRAGVDSTGNNYPIDQAVTMTERFRLNTSGDGHFDGDVVAYSSTVSDKRLKENITTIDNALDKVMALRGVEYDWTATSRKGTHDLGLVAQEVEEVLPELVTEHELCTGEFGGEGNEKTFKTVNYDKMVGVLIEAIKEQQQQINKLQEKLNG